MKKLAVFITALLMVTAFIQGCKKDTNNAVPSSNSGSSNVKIFLTDAPGDYEEVNVEILQVELHSTGGGWQTDSLLNPGIYNLLDYSNGLDTLIFSDSLPVGTISQIRLILGTNNTVKIGGVVYPLTTPSAQQSGLKLQIHKEILAGVTYSITLDFDAAKSIVKTGNDKYILKPVIRTITKEVDLGGLKGVVAPAKILPLYAIMGTDTTGAFTNSNGEFLIQDLPSGTYSVVILAPAPDTTITLNNIIVTDGQINDLGIINL